MKIASGALILALATIFSACTPQVTLQVGGVQVPDNVVQATLPASGIQVSTYYTRIFTIPEGDEALEAVEYLKFSPEMQKIDADGLQKLVLRAIIWNPGRIRYAIWSRHGHDEAITEEVLYEGGLSRKEVEIQLPTWPGVTRQAGFTLMDEHGLIIYEGPMVRYTVTK